MFKNIKPLQTIVLTFLLLTMLTACTAAEDSYSEPVNTKGPTVTPLPTKTEEPTRTPKPTETLTPIPTALPAELFEGGLIIMNKAFNGYDLFKIYSPLDQPMQMLPIANEVTRTTLSPDGKIMFYILGGAEDMDVKSRGTYWYNLQTDENVLVNKDTLTVFEWSPNGKWVTASTSSFDSRATNQAIYVYDLQGNQQKVYQPRSANYSIGDSNYSMAIFGGFAPADWYDNQNLMYRYYSGSMPKSLSRNQTEIQPDTIGTYNVLRHAGTANDVEEAVAETENEESKIQETIISIDATDENLQHAYDNSYDFASADGSWALFHDYPNYVWQVGKFNETTHSYTRKEFTPCQNCEPYGFVPNTDEVFYLQRTDTSYKIFTTSPQDFDPQLVGSFSNKDICEVETGDVDKSFIWNGTWVGDISKPTIAFIERCIIQGEGGHYYVSIMDLSDNTKTRLYEVDGSSKIVTWTPPITITEEEPATE